MIFPLFFIILQDNQPEKEKERLARNANLSFSFQALLGRSGRGWGDGCDFPIIEMLLSLLIK
jgi:hypothetical protein